MKNVWCQIQGCYFLATDWGVNSKLVIGGWTVTRGDAIIWVGNWFSMRQPVDRLKTCENVVNSPLKVIFRVI